MKLQRRTAVRLYGRGRSHAERGNETDCVTRKIIKRLTGVVKIHCFSHRFFSSRIKSSALPQKMLTEASSKYFSKY